MGTEPGVAMAELGRWIIYAGLLLVVLGGLILLFGRLGIGRLPGDLVWQWGDTTINLPLGTMIVLSLLLTAVLNLVLRLLR